MQKFYLRLDDYLKEFHVNTTIDATTINSTNTNLRMLSPVYHNDLGLTYEEARLVMSFLRLERPLYYWLSNRWRYSSSQGYILPQVEDIYALGEDRAYYNNLLYEYIEELYSAVQTEQSPYMLALAYHDAIISRIDYAYEADGETPQDAIWAHSVMGVVTGDGVVCEGYAKMFQLLLNFSGVEAIYVTGNPEAPHGWNLIQLDDGNWYWCDLTWDDSKTSQDTYFSEMKYNYFCVNDTQFVNWQDELLNWNNYYTGNTTFVDGHTPNNYNSVPDKMFDLPERSDNVFDSDDIVEIRETFTVNGYTYALVGYKKVQLVYTNAIGILNVPEYVCYNGTVYTVVSIGAMIGDFFFTANDKISSNHFEDIIIPDTVEYVWKNAL
jgi:hypothetical protein